MWIFKPSRTGEGWVEFKPTPRGLEMLPEESLSSGPPQVRRRLSFDTRRIFPPRKDGTMERRASLSSQRGHE